MIIRCSGKIYYNENDVKKIYQKQINGITIHDLNRKLFNEVKYEVFSKTKNWGISVDKYGKNTHGVINTEKKWINSVQDKYEDPYWSNINYWDNNYKVTTRLLNIHNKINTVDKEINLLDGDISIEWEKFQNFIRKNKIDIFCGKYTDELLDCVRETRGIGDENEKIVYCILLNNPNITNVKQFGSGSVEDKSGIDIKFDLDGINKTMQIKTFKNNKKHETSKNYIFEEITSWEYTNCDYIALSNNSIVYFFDNGSYYNKKELKYTFPISSFRGKNNFII